MRAAWYDQQGPAAQVLRVGQLPDPEPDPGEVRVRVRYSGVNPGDTKKRRGWLGSSMPYPRVVPHSDAAGSPASPRTGRSSATARSPAAPSSCRGSWGASADWPRSWRPGGASVLGTVRRSTDLDAVPPAVRHAVALDTDDPVAASGTREDRPDLPFWPLLFDNVTIRLLGSDDFPPEARRQAADDLTTAAAAGALSGDVIVLPLSAVAEAHDLVDAGSRRRVLLSLAD